ncbi:MAG: hypothetical protein WCK20_06970, partial [Thermoleophilia bacterium]
TKPRATGVIRNSDALVRVSVAVPVAGTCLVVPQLVTSKPHPRSNATAMTRRVDRNIVRE